MATKAANRRRKQHIELVKREIEAAKSKQEGKPDNIKRYYAAKIDQLTTTLRGLQFNTKD